MRLAVIFIDAHVHLRGCFKVPSFLGKACANLEREASRFDQGGPFDGVLCVVDPNQGESFERLLTYLKREQPRRLEGKMKNWYFQETAEETSILLTTKRRKSLFIVAGHQLESQERIEVLAIGTNHQFGADKPAGYLIQKIAQIEGLPILPWGVGKWLGGRGEIIERLIYDTDLPQFFLGDSANRPPFWPKPSLFEVAEKAGIRNLPGSDPLPIPGEERYPGSFGAALEGTLDARMPVRDLKERLLDRTVNFHHFGHRKSLLRLVHSQIVMQYMRLAE